LQVFWCFAISFWHCFWPQSHCSRYLHCVQSSAAVIKQSTGI
jgi:hypothetical protein